ncbi:putative catabolic 3-dehydroquinase [Microstroma glucosiphilum]|uniref:Catabolic 3-dehydroquinase n=1 Tax=Pseudomicrostroma glucosiphilum TaxID=1684307 RepID=A0A316U6L3_9BASI|nr:putative catabolic 3-dehydroquinase [Pseudomicrostroma glucosiphilum]PWN20464.1 putative catabolic 3-dehydroquinase [Pseudomicrostroma glucosiphilum]
MASTRVGAGSILLLNGPNLNMLGTREPERYGSTTLDDVETQCAALVSSHPATSGSSTSSSPVFSAYQSNHEGDLIDRIHEAKQEGVEAIIINAGAYTHTSVAVRDALLSVDIPFFEVHVTNVHAREPFRHHSYLSDKAAGIIVGLGVHGYYAAINYCLTALTVKVATT